MKRRDFVKSASAGAVAGVLAGAPYVQAQSHVRWRLAASWPTSLDTILGGAKTVAERVQALTGGRFRIRVYAAGELVGGLQVFDAVQQGTVQMGHTSSYYYVGKSPSLAFDTALPFGLTTRQQNAWMTYGGGRELMNDTVLAPFGILSLPAGNTGCQMGGWFRQEVPDLASLQGVRMRIPGFGGKVMAAMGVNVQTIAAAEIYPALERGVVDAAEWVGPYDDERLGFHQVAKYYYAPGWWEPGPQLSALVNKAAYDKLPAEFQEALASAAAQANLDMAAHYDAVNATALKRLLGQGVQLRTFSQDIMEAARQRAFEMYEDLAIQDATWAKVYANWKAFRAGQYSWFDVAEMAYAEYAFGRA